MAQSWGEKVTCKDCGKVRMNKLVILTRIDATHVGVNADTEAKLEVAEWYWQRMR